MRGVDTNVLIRILVEDDPAQAKRAHAFVAQCRASGEAVFVASLVVCELVWVLRSAYGKTKAQVVGTLEQLVSSDMLVFESGDLVQEALELYRTGSGDFADYFVGLSNQARQCKETVTFDRALRSAPGFAAL